MTRRWPVLIAAGFLIAAVAYAYGFEGGSLQDRVARHVLATVLQVAAPLLAGIGCAAAARAYARGDPERRVWATGAAAALVWTAGRAIFAFDQWWGQKALPYPSVADGFFVAFYVLLAAALALEVRLVLPMVDRSVRLALFGFGVAGWAVGFVYILEPIVVSSTGLMSRFLSAFYPTAAVFLIPAGLVPAIGFRGGLSAYPWLAVTAAALCLAAASLGYALLTWYDLSSQVHGINALWVVGFVLLGLGGFWQKKVQEEV